MASKREENKIEGMVKNKLANIHSGEWAEEVAFPFSLGCVQMLTFLSLQIFRKTPARYQKLIPALATQV